MKVSFACLVLACVLVADGLILSGAGDGRPLLVYLFEFPAFIFGVWWAVFFLLHHVVGRFLLARAPVPREERGPS